MARLCPNDRNALTTRTIHDIQVDVCPVCGGLWLDKGEMFKLRSLSPNMEKDFEIKPAQRPSASTPNPVCPVCAKPLTPFHYPGGNANLETCPDLDGIWVPEPEMEKIAEAHLPPEAASLLAQAAADSSEQVYRYKRAEDVFHALDYHIGWPYIWGIPQPWW